MKALTYTLRDIPSEERPRERMLQHGPQALNNAELLAVLLRTGTVAESAVRLAERVLQHAGSLRQLVDMSLEQLTELKGVGPAKALQIQASIELGRRLARTTSASDERTALLSPQDAAGYIMEDLRYLTKEHFVCLFLNTKNRVVGQETLSIGSLNASIVHPREVFRAAIRRGCASIIVAHNHPSGDPTPSPEDIQLTGRLVESGQLVGIDVLDHIVVGDGIFISLKEKGFM